MTDMMVMKPWGFEYLFYENESVAVWCLHISEGHETSLHCHPNKKTGLVLLAGEAALSFLNDTVEMKWLDRQVLRPGLFHSTRAVGSDVVMLEVEAPPNKEDIVRFEDKYGREGAPIEGVSEMRELGEEYPRLGDGRAIGGCKIAVRRMAVEKNAVIAVLSGGLRAGEDVIVEPGDVGTMRSFTRLAMRFETIKGTELLSICEKR